MCINVKVFDAITALPGRGCSIRKALPEIDHAKVISGTSAERKGHPGGATPLRRIHVFDSARRNAAD